MDNLYDLIILGGGPGGLAAGIYGARAKLKTGIIEKGKPGGQAATTEELENYPGFGPGTTGPELTKAMADHAAKFGADFIKDTIVSLDLAGSPKKIMGKKDVYLAKAVIFAMGAEPRMLGIPGEGKLRGKGVSYCATCDADLFTELDVIVIGSGDAAIEEAEYLTRFAENVTVIVIHEEGKVDANMASAERAFKNPKLNWKWNSIVKTVNGDELVETVTLKNIKTGEEEEFPTNGVFIFIGTQPKTELLQGMVELTPQGYVVTSEKMETSIEGVFAAGDCRNKYLRQVVTAAADGAVAAVAAEKYVHENEMWEKEVLHADHPVMVALYNPTDMSGTEKVGIIDRFVQNRDNLSLIKVDATRNELVKKRYRIDYDQLPQVYVFDRGEVKEIIKNISQEQLEKFVQ
jgi:thioredoxin reductase (NADPH)